MARVAGQYRAIVTSTSNTAISHTGKRGRALTGVAALGGAGLAWVAGRRIERSQITQGLVAAPGGGEAWALAASTASRFLRAPA